MYELFSPITKNKNKKNNTEHFGTISKLSKHFFLLNYVDMYISNKNNNNKYCQRR